MRTLKSETKRLLTMLATAILCLGGLTQPTLSSAQSFGQSDQFYDDAEAEWQQYKQSQQQGFKNYLSEQDREFADFLKQHWREFDIYTGKIRDIQPKPPKAPAVRNWLGSVYETLGGWVTAPFKAVFGESPKRDTPTLPDNLFFGHQLDPIDFPQTSLPDLSQPDNKVLAAFWQAAASANLTLLLKQLENDKQALGLGDWSYYLYLDQRLGSRFKQQNQRVAFEWFLLNKQGYNIKLAYDDRNLYLLFPSNQTIYGKSFVEIDGTTYYLIQKKRGDAPLMSYPGYYQADNRAIQLQFSRVMAPSQIIRSRMLSYRIGRQKKTANLQFDAGYSELLSHYPQTDLNSYFRAQPDSITRNSLRQQLLPQIRRLPPREAVNYLLTLTQTGFGYATDQDQFGEENYLLTEESLEYPANDCEDRSIFLAWLLRDLMNIKVLALDFPGHVALAVKLPPEPGDWQITSQGEHYVVADPTYIGAKVGMVMPSVAKLKPRVIHF